MTCAAIALSVLYQSFSIVLIIKEQGILLPSCPDKISSYQGLLTVGLRPKYDLWPAAHSDKIVWNAMIQASSKAPACC